MKEKPGCRGPAERSQGMNLPAAIGIPITGINDHTPGDQTL